MKTKLEKGDKVWFKSVKAGMIKAVVVYVATEGLYSWEVARVTLKVTSRKNPIYPCGTVFQGDPIWITMRS